MEKSVHPEHYSAQRLGGAKEGSYIPGEIEKLIKTIKVMYKFEQQLNDKIDILLSNKLANERVLKIYIAEAMDKKRNVQSLNKINREIVDLNDKIKLLERIMYDYVDFQDKLHSYVDIFYRDLKRRDIEEFITDKLDETKTDVMSDEEAEYLCNGAEDAITNKIK